MSVNVVFQSASISQKRMSTLPEFTLSAAVVGFSLSALTCVMYFRFCGRRHHRLMVRTQHSTAATTVTFSPISTLPVAPPVGRSTIVPASCMSGCFKPILNRFTHSLIHSKLKTFLFCKSFPPQPFLFFFRTDYMDFPDCLLLLLSISFFFFYFFCFTLFSCRFRAVD